MTGTLKICGVTKQMAGKDVVSQLDLSVRAGELFVLVGESGSGKTTILRMIDRLIEPSAGQIRLDGKPIESFPVTELHRSIGYIFQQGTLFPTMTVYQNIALIPELKHWAATKIHERASTLMDAVSLPLSTYAGRYPHELSGGEQQRVGIVRALIADPKLILMDEPFSALDPIVRQELQTLLLRLHEELDSTVIFVTHDMQEALRLGDRIGVMRAGCLLQVDAPKVLRQHPANQFVASLFANQQQQGFGDIRSSELIKFALPTHEVLGETLNGNASINEVITSLDQHSRVFIEVSTGRYVVTQQVLIKWLCEFQQ